MRLAAPLALLMGAGAAMAQADGGPAPASAASDAASAASAASAPAPDRSDALQRVASSPLGSCLRRAPAYPQAARQRGEAGRSVVAFTVDADGLPAQPELSRGSGSALLDQAALAHLQRCIEQSKARLARDQAAAAVPQPAPAPEPSRVLVRPPAPAEPLPPGRYQVPIRWQLEE